MRVLGAIHDRHRDYGQPPSQPDRQATIVEIEGNHPRDVMCPEVIAFAPKERAWVYISAYLFLYRSGINGLPLCCLP